MSMRGSELNRIPLATYRLQFNREFTFANATGILDYLKELGISDVYASPLFQATPGSMHGYDVCGFDRINPSLGTEEDARRFFEGVKERGFGLLLDMVPNHMGAHLSNCWWRDVLQNGPQSRFAKYFDIDWNSPDPRLRDKVLLPLLGDELGVTLEKGELKLVYENSELQLAYFDKKLPISPVSAAAILKEADGELERALGIFNGTAGNPESFQKVRQLLEEQYYRLEFWRTGPARLNYRRFFDITELAAVKVETPEVFEATHKLLFELVRGAVTGLRIDHPDGLWNPTEYFHRLQHRYESLPQVLPGKKVYVVVEKILSEGELLPPEWPVSGTTGYDFLNCVNGLFVASANEKRFTEIYKHFTGRDADYDEVIYKSKKRMLAKSFIAETNALVSRLRELGEALGQRFNSEEELRGPLMEAICAFKVYRTYLNEQRTVPTEQERDVIESAVRRARIKLSAVREPGLRFLEQVLLLNHPGARSPELCAQMLGFVMRFQQLTGPVMAKGLEDTAFYRYFPMVSLNEVGGNPGGFGTSREEFHEHNQVKRERWTHSLLATATHDTKRGEDVRARINVLSELPDEWRRVVERWSELNSQHRADAGPSRNDEYLLYQTLVGSWTSDCSTQHGLDEYRERISAYMLKAIREAKLNTSWAEANEPYEAAVRIFVDQVLAKPDSPFLAEFQAFQAKISFFGYLNSLAQLVLKIAAPGVPDCYQGTELWDFSLVDPDNRRPVDFACRHKLLTRARDGLTNPREALSKALAHPETGEIKLLTTCFALHCRSRNRDVFDFGKYLPVQAEGPKSDHVVAFSRQTAEAEIITVSPRLVVTLTAGKQILPLGGSIWSDTVLALPRQGRFKNLFTHEQIGTDGGRLRLAEIFASLPLALLERIV